MHTHYLIFDFDGVIGDTWEAAIGAHLERRTKPTRELAIEEMNLYFNRRPHHTRTHTLTPEELIREYEWTTLFGEVMHKIGFKLFDDFVKEIEAIETPYKAIVSSGSHKYVIPALQRTNINPTHVLAFEDHHSKEEKIEMICRDWNVSIKDVYYFTDSLADVYELQDFISPDKLIGVTWGFSGKENLLKELKEEHILESPAQFNNILKS